VISTILQHGEFTGFDVSMTAKSLMAFAIGLPAFMLVKVLASAFYSTQDIKTPVKIAITAVISNIFLDFILIFPLAHAGLALATSLATTLNASFLFYILCKRKIFIPQPGWFKYILQLGFANIIMAIMLLFTSGEIARWLTWDNKQRVLHLFPILIAAVIIYMTCLFITGIRWRNFKFK